MSIGNLKNNGNKGNNFPYQLANLQLLQSIATGVTPPGGLATEATALNILTAIQNGQEFEQNLVVDLGGAGCPNNCPTYLMVRVWNTVTHTFDPSIYYDASGALVVPVGPIELVNPQFVLNNILMQVTAINTDLDVALSTRASEATLLATNVLLTSIQSGTTNLDVALSTRASETTLSALVTLLTGVSKTPSVVSALVNGSTTAGVKAVSLWFRGNNGTLGGISVPNGARFTYSADDNNDTVGALAYTVPTTGEQRIIITYLS